MERAEWFEYFEKKKAEHRLNIAARKRALENSTGQGDNIRSEKRSEIGTKSPAQKTIHALPVQVKSEVKPSTKGEVDRRPSQATSSSPTAVTTEQRRTENIDSADASQRQNNEARAASAKSSPIQADKISAKATANLTAGKPTPPLKGFKIPKSIQNGTFSVNSAKTSSMASPADQASGPSTSSTPSVPVASVAAEYQRPSWCAQVQCRRWDRSKQIRLTRIRELIDKCDSRGQPSIDLIQGIRGELHFQEHLQVDEAILVKSRLLDPQYGLQRLFATPNSDRYPFDIRADAKGLFVKWRRMDLDPDIMRGIKEVKNQNGRLVYSLDPTHPQIKADNTGAGDLVNGQWWPLLLCALRDGAHGSAQAGIYGRAPLGAFSIIVSKSPYADRDSGAELDYCGTHRETEAGGEATAMTKLLKTNIARRAPVRVLRSAGLPSGNRWRPARGFRYDGLYDVLGFEVLDARKGIHRFRLKRQDGQDEIRCQGLAARPTAEDVSAFDAHVVRRDGVGDI